MIDSEDCQLRHAHVHSVAVADIGGFLKMRMSGFIDVHARGHRQVVSRSALLRAFPTQEAGAQDV